MEGPWLDRLTRRRSGVVAGSFAVSLLGLLGREDAAGKKHRKKHKKKPKKPCDKLQKGQSCSTDDQCCSGQCTANQCE
jgi:hypothetical protein